MENQLFNELAEKMMKGEITRKQATKSFEAATKKKVVKKQELTAAQRQMLKVSKYDDDED